MFWEQEDKESQDPYGTYLDTSLQEYGLTILAKTEDYGYNRGEGILDFLSDNPVDSWIILDDEIFGDYEETGCLEHLVQTSWSHNGLTRTLADKAIQLFQSFNK